MASIVTWRGQVQHLEELGNGGNFLGLVIHFDLTQHEPIGVWPTHSPCASQFSPPPVKGMAQRFPVESDDVATAEVAQSASPSDETLGQFLRSRRDKTRRKVS